MKFAVNDWVQITPTPDTKWHIWFNEQEIYDNFCGRIGQIISIYDSNKNETYYDVMVHFPKGFGVHPTGNYFQMFKGDHLIKSSAYDAKVQYNLEKAGDEIQKLEKCIKNKRDEIFRYICSPKVEEEEKKQVDFNPDSMEYDHYYDQIYDDMNSLRDDPDADPDQWDVKTVPNMPNPIINKNTTNQNNSNTSTAGNTSQSSTSTYTDPYDISFYDTTD